MLRSVLALAAVLGLAAVLPAVASAENVSVGACVVGICTDIPPQAVPIEPVLGCEAVGSPPVDPVLGGDAVLVVVCV